MDNIEPGLYLGDLFSGRGLELLTKNKITHILVVGMELTKHFPEVFFILFVIVKKMYC
jgi:hypothetical protein